jgi:acyl carrier protein
MNTEHAIRNWIVTRVAKELQIPAEDIDPQSSLDRFGLDSQMAIALTADLADFIGTNLDPTIIYDYPTIAQLAEFLARSFPAAKSER